MKRNKQPQKAAGPELDISSLIDVSFLLLIFFIVTSTLIKRESQLSLDIPVDGPAVDPAVPLKIDIASDGRISIGGQELAGPSDGSLHSRIEDVRRELVEHKERSAILKEAPLVNVSASGEASSQRFIDVMNALAYAEIKHITISDLVATN